MTLRSISETTVPWLRPVSLPASRREEDAHLPVTVPKLFQLRNGRVELTRSGIGAVAGGLGALAVETWPVSVPSDYRSPTFGSTTVGEDLERAIAQSAAVNAQSFDRYQSQMPSGPQAYPDRSLRFENLIIRTRNTGIVVQGAGTVIRNNIIETDDGTAIWSYGPNALIENNTIIVHGTDDGPGGPIFPRPADAPIRVHHADGTIIRNNRIIILGRHPDRALSVFDTGEFRFEANKIYGVTAESTAIAALTGELKIRALDNTYHTGSLGKFRGWIKKRGGSAILG